MATNDQQVHELGDVLAWLTSLAHQLGISLDEAAQRYVTNPQFRPSAENEKDPAASCRVLVRVR